MSQVKRKRTVRADNFSTFIYRVLKHVHPELSISKNAMAAMEDINRDVFERVAQEAGRLARYNNKSTITAREIQSAVRLVFPGELAKHAVFEANRAVAKYNTD